MFEMNVPPGPNVHHGPVDAWMRWPWVTVFPETVLKAHTRLQEIYWGAKLRWNEQETMRRVILPILTEILGYPAGELTETPEEYQYYGENRLHPDLYLPGICVVEAKRMKVPLLRYSGDAAKFASPLDQGLTYLDKYNAKSCIVTNGWDWYVFWKTENWDQFSKTNIINYFGLRFRLDEAASSNDMVRLEQFLSMLNYTSISGAANDLAAVTGCSLFKLDRKLYNTQSHLFWADFSNGPVNGRGSGFNFSPEPDPEV